ncbi:MAG: SCO family protein, partial [Rhizobiales bacterium]|nr:SCO family protein [Hyphomicrobiales bacterium]
MLRIALWGAVGLAGAAFVLVSTGLLPKPGSTSDATAISVNEIGGPFRLTSHTGKPFSDADVKGLPFALFFGFTSCPEVCPTTLSQLSSLMEKLGPKADRMQILFATVDPGRDTPEQLASYLSSFDPRIVGLTGTPAEVDALTKAFKAYYRKVETGDGDYPMDHT